jgi:hypothetical protein
MHDIRREPQVVETDLPFFNRDGELRGIPSYLRSSDFRSGFRSGTPGFLWPGLAVRLRPPGPLLIPFHPGRRGFMPCTGSLLAHLHVRVLRRDHRSACARWNTGDLLEQVTDLLKH